MCFFFKQKTAYEMRISDWSSDVCSSDLLGERGEVCIRGPQVMLGYWQKPEETRRCMTPDGFFRTGDIGIMDEKGYTRIVDRKKDMIAVSGFKVYPTEVEAVIAAHPGLLECEVVGVPDGHSGDAVKAFRSEHRRVGKEGVS